MVSKNIALLAHNTYFPNEFNADSLCCFCKTALFSFLPQPDIYLLIHTNMLIPFLIMKPEKGKIPGGKKKRERKKEKKAVCFNLLLPDAHLQFCIFSYLKYRCNC